MAAESGGPSARVRSILDRLRAEPYEFDFFQAMRIMERAFRDRVALGYDAGSKDEIVRLRPHLSLAFPPSQILTFEPPDEYRPIPLMTVTFFGLYGSSGVLPTHYTQMLLDLVRDVRGPERRSLRDWLDIFNHRLISLFHRAWEKYRCYIAFERNPGDRDDPFTLAVRGIVGVAGPALTDRLRVTVPLEASGFESSSEKRLASIDDLALLYYAGIFSQRPRNAANLTNLVADYFDVPTEIRQFQGQWLPIAPENQTQLGMTGALGVNAVAGSRVWDVQSKFRVRIGPLKYAKFEDLIPDREPVPARKTFFLLAQLVRMFAGSEYDFDVQLVLGPKDVPQAQLGSAGGVGPRLGWNVWLISAPPPAPVGDAVFNEEWVVRL